MFLIVFNEVENDNFEKEEKFLGSKIIMTFILAGEAGCSSRIESGSDIDCDISTLSVDPPSFSEYPNREADLH